MSARPARTGRVLRRRVASSASSTTTSLAFALPRAARFPPRGAGFHAWSSRATGLPCASGPRRPCSARHGHSSPNRAIPGACRAARDRISRCSARCAPGRTIVALTRSCCATRRAGCSRGRTRVCCGGRTMRCARHRTSTSCPASRAGCCSQRRASAASRCAPGHRCARELAGRETWLTSALHGIRVVSTWVSPPMEAGREARAAAWRAELDRDG